MITQSELKELFYYDPETGMVTRKIKTSRRTKMGGIVGSLFTSGAGKKYLRTQIGEKQYRLHRLIWLYVTGEFPPYEIDHVDGCGVNNKWSNLRSVTGQINKQNMRKYITNSSGVSGIEWHKSHARWRVRIGLGEHRKHVGYYDNLFDAACARKSAERLHNYHINHGSDRPL